MTSPGPTPACSPGITSPSAAAKKGAKAMFGNDPRDLTKALAEMHTQARQKANFNQAEAKQRMAEWLLMDRRFDGYDPSRLIDRVEQCRSNGAVLDLEDPWLQRGGQRRPLSW